MKDITNISKQISAISLSGLESLDNIHKKILKEFPNYPLYIKISAYDTISNLSRIPYTTKSVEKLIVEQPRDRRKQK